MSCDLLKTEAFQAIVVFYGRMSGLIRIGIGILRIKLWKYIEKMFFFVDLDTVYKYI